MRCASLAATHGGCPSSSFAIACLVASIGPGAIPSVALIVPLAMVIGERAAVPHFLTTLMVANGANAGNLSPVSAVGVIVNTKMAEAGLGGHEGKVWFANLAAHLLVAMVAYFLLGGHKLSGKATPAPSSGASFAGKQRLILAVILVWVTGVLALKLNVGLSAFAAATLLVAAGAADEGAAVKRVPWGVIKTVCGVSVLIALLDATGGMELFSALLSRMATPSTVNGVMAFVTGSISTYSSTCRRGVAHVPADGPRSDREPGRRRPTCTLPQYQRRVIARGRIAAFHAGRPVRRRRAAGRGSVSSIDDLGRVHVRGRCTAFSVVRRRVSQKLGKGMGNRSGGLTKRAREHPRRSRRHAR